MADPIRVFVSYRREDTKHPAGRLAEKLDPHFEVFIDIDNIEPGTDFTEVVHDHVEMCQIFVPVIGVNWAGLDPETGARRLDDPRDWVAAETAAALDRGVPIIPVLVDGAVMPTAEQLPERLARLANRHAVSVRHESFNADVGRLVESIKRRVTPTVPSAPSLSTTPAPPGRAESAYHAALAAYYAKRWEEAVVAFEKVVALDPQYPRAAERLAESRHRAQLGTSNAQADRALAERRWVDAVVLLEQVRALDPRFPDLDRRLELATYERRIADLERDLRSLAAAKDWASVITAGAELAALDPRRGDPDGLVTRAHREIREAGLAERYAGGLVALDRGEFEAAMAVFEALQREQPGYRETPALAAEARRRLLSGLHAHAAQAEAAGRLPEAADALRRLQALIPGDRQIYLWSERIEYRMRGKRPFRGKTLVVVLVTLTVCIGLTILVSYLGQ